MIDSVFRTDKNYHLQECTYVGKEKKMSKYITDDIEIFSDSDREDSDEGNCNEENCNEENLMKKILMKKILTKKILMKKIKNAHITCIAHTKNQ